MLMVPDTVKGKRVSRRKNTVCHKAPGWLGLESWGTSDALGGLVEQQKDVPPRLPETGSLPPTNAPPPPPARAGEEDAAAGRQTPPSAPSVSCSLHSKRARASPAHPQSTALGTHF